MAQAVLRMAMAMARGPGSGMRRAGMGAVGGAMTKKWSSGAPLFLASKVLLRRGCGRITQRPGRAGLVHCAINNEAPSNPTVYQGVYGPWSIDPADIREVVLYRAGLVTSAAAFVTAASTAFLPDDSPIKSAIQGLYDPLYAVGAGGLGLSLVLIHIYLTPIKRTLQLLWVLGVLGSLGAAINFAGPAEQGLVQFVVENPGATWAVGPLFAALTGLAFKEGLCYGKFEAAGLFFVIPGLLLGHLSGVMDEKLKLGLLAAWIGLFVVFASRKFSQPVKDDLGDKSVFIFNALPEEEKMKLQMKLQEQSNKDSQDE